MKKLKIQIIFSLSFSILSSCLFANSYTKPRSFNIGVVGYKEKVYFVRGELPKSNELRAFAERLREHEAPKSILYIGHDGHVTEREEARATDWQAEQDFFIKGVFFDPIASENIHCIELLREKKGIHVFKAQLKEVLTWCIQQIEKEAFPILIHCDQGQHRTGRIALILELALKANPFSCHKGFMKEAFGDLENYFKSKIDGFKEIRIYDKRWNLISEEGRSVDPFLCNYLSHLPWQKIPTSNKLPEEVRNELRADSHDLLIFRTQARIEEIQEHKTIRKHLLNYLSKKRLKKTPSSK